MKRKIVLRWASEAIITYTLDADSDAEFEKRLNELVTFGDADGVKQIHRIDEILGTDAEVTVNEPVL